MNWFVCVLGLLGVATIVCLCLHQYQQGGSGATVSTAEAFADYTSSADEAELVATGVAVNAQDLLAPSSPLPPVGEEVATDEYAAEEEKAGYAEEEDTSVPPTSEEAVVMGVSKRRRSVAHKAAAVAEEEVTPSSPLDVLDVIDDIAASTATAAEEQVVVEEEHKKAAAATVATRTPPVQAVLQVIDVPPPEEEQRVVPEEEAAPIAEEATTTEAVSYQDETYAYHPSPKDEVVEVDEPGYVYLPSRFWSVPQKRPPPCTPATKPKVCPIFTDGVPEGALEWRSTVRERQLRAAVRPARARHRRDPKLDYYYPGYYAKGDTYKHKCA